MPESRTEVGEVFQRRTVSKATIASKETEKTEAGFPRSTGTGCQWELFDPIHMEKCSSWRDDAPEGDKDVDEEQTWEADDDPGAGTDTDVREAVPAEGRNPEERRFVLTRNIC